MRTLVAVIGVVAAAFLTIAQFGTAGWTRPPIVAKQQGFRGTAMDHIQTKAGAKALRAANVAPETPEPASAEGEKAGETYENVKVLKDLSVEQFNRLMASMTEWVSPEQGCTFCHNTENMADDSLYQKRVARRMIQMVQVLNTDWKDRHIGETGVTCYTCHRGQAVPPNVWFDNPGLTAKGLTRPRNNGQNMASAEVGLASLPYNTLTEYLSKKDVDENAIRVNATTALPESHGKTIQDTEKTYGLMIHMSKSLGVNCTYCHNTRAISQWSQSTPQRTSAWYGIRMVRALNAEYLEPSKADFPANRLGPHGDVPKVNCATCHNGQNKPLAGAHVVEGFPELATKPVAVNDPQPGGAEPNPAPQ